MTYEQMQALVEGMTDEEFVNVVLCANERIAGFDRADLGTELCQTAMAIVAATIEGPASGAYAELGDCIDEFDAVLGRGVVFEGDSDGTYTCTFTRAQMRESAAALGHALDDETCDRIARYAAEDVVNEERMEGYLG